MDYKNPWLRFVGYVLVYCSDLACTLLILNMKLLVSIDTKTILLIFISVTGRCTGPLQSLVSTNTLYKFSF